MVNLQSEKQIILRYYDALASAKLEEIPEYAIELFQEGNDKALTNNAKLTGLGESPKVFVIPKGIETPFMKELSRIIKCALEPNTEIPSIPINCQHQTLKFGKFQK